MLSAAITWGIVSICGVLVENATIIALLFFSVKKFFPESPDKSFVSRLLNLQ
jgi:hypothetical protein